MPIPKPLELLDIFSIWCGRLLALGGLLLAFVYMGARVLDLALQRAGMAGMFLDFARREFHKAPRSFWARLFWGKPDANS